jgi:hypothetical protein
MESRVHFRVAHCNSRNPLIPVFHFLSLLLHATRVLTANCIPNVWAGSTFTLVVVERSGRKFAAAATRLSAIWGAALRRRLWLQPWLDARPFAFTYQVPRASVPQVAGARKESARPHSGSPRSRRGGRRLGWWMNGTSRRTRRPRRWRNRLESHDHRVRLMIRRSACGGVNAHANHTSE